MTDWDSFIYLTILLIAIGGSFLFANRHRLGPMLKQAGVWVLLFGGAIMAVGIWQDITSSSTAPIASIRSDGAITLPKQQRGHVRAIATINGEQVEFLVDTGASEIVLTMADAAKIGLTRDKLNFIGVAYTANGPVETAPVILESFELGNVVDRKIRASVNKGDLDISLLGMAYLNRFSSIELTPEAMILKR